MFAYKLKIFLACTVTSISLFSCKKETNMKGFEAYFGGEIINPNSKFVYLCKDNLVIDTITLDNKNMFHKKYDYLSPGLYTFRHDPEFQYIYFDKNDSLMIRLNAVDFDNSLTFCGKGDEKNNFLMDLFLKNKSSRNNSYTVYDKDFKTFYKLVNKDHNYSKNFYNRRKNEINWSDDFDIYAKAMLNFEYLTRLEMYPLIHKRITNEDVCKSLPKNYYSFRKTIDYNNDKLTNFSPFTLYLRSMLDNVCCEDSKGTPLENNVKKLNVANQLFTNQKIKNIVLNKIAFIYLLEDQNMANNKKFFDRYFQLSTSDNKEQDEIKKIIKATHLLKEGNHLPEINLIDTKGEKVNFDGLLTSNTVVTFWTTDAKSHLEISHKKMMELQKKHSNWNFISINIDDTKEQWLKELSNYSFKNTKELYSTDFEDIKNKWAITKIHRAMLINKGGTIRNAFVSIFDADFEKKLE